MRGMGVPIAVVHRPKQTNAVRKLAQVKMYFTSKNVKQKSVTYFDSGWNMGKLESVVAMLRIVWGWRKLPRT